MSQFPWEDSLLERKTEGYDDEAFLKTMVAFANSVRPNHTAIILVGERDNGKIVGVKDPDKFQFRLHKIAKQIYPAIVWRSRIYEKDGKLCVRVEIEYSGETPHFGGVSWIRKGSETIKATDEVFQSLIDFRSSKIRELAKFLGKEITISLREEDSRYYESLDTFQRGFGPIWEIPKSVKLVFVNQFWLTIDYDEIQYSFSMEEIILSFDNEKKQLQIKVKQ